MGHTNEWLSRRIEMYGDEHLYESSLGTSFYWSGSPSYLDVSGGINQLNDIGDVSTGGKAFNQVLTWKGTFWEAEDVSAAGSGASYEYVDGSLNDIRTTYIPDSSIATQPQIDASVPFTNTVVSPHGLKNMRWENLDIPCADNATTNINISDTSNGNSSFLMHFQAHRVMDTSLLYQSGMIHLLVDPSERVYYNSDWVGEELDYSIAGDVNGTDIRLNIIVGSDNANNLFFHYNNISNIYS